MADIIVSSDIDTFMQSADVAAARSNLNLPNFPLAEGNIKIEDSTSAYNYEIVAGDLTTASADVTCTLPDLGAADIFVFADHSQVLQNKTMDYLVNTFQNFPVEYIVACSDETTDLTTGTAKVTFRAPVAFEITDVRASLTTAVAGADLIVDVNLNASSIFTTDLLTIDDGDKTSVGATNPPNITTTTVSADDEITIDIDQVGSSTAGTGLKVTIIGTRA